MQIVMIFFEYVQRKLYTWIWI